MMNDKYKDVEPKYAWDKSLMIYYIGIIFILIVIKNSKWFNRLFQDPAFVARVKERFTYFYNHKNDILKEIDSDAYYLRNAILENNNKWEVYEVYSTSELNRLYKNDVSAMKTWFENRLDWLNEQFSKM